MGKWFPQILSRLGREPTKRTTSQWLTAKRDCLEERESQTWAWKQVKGWFPTPTRMDSTSSSERGDSVSQPRLTERAHSVLKYKITDKRIQNNWIEDLKRSMSIDGLSQIHERNSHSISVQVKSKSNHATSTSSVLRDIQLIRRVDREEVSERHGLSGVWVIWILRPIARSHCQTNWRLGIYYCFKLQTF